MTARHIALPAILLSTVTLAGPAVHAQEGISVRDAVAASILSDMARDKQQEREAKRQPYQSGERGPIASAAEARDACSTEIVAEIGGGSQIIGTPTARTMATGWEVEGHAGPDGDRASVPFVCSVRNGLVSGTLLRRQD